MSAPSAEPGQASPAQPQPRSLPAVRRSLRPRDRRCGHLEAGFTLIEMLVVLIIIGLLVGIVGPKVFAQLSDAKVKTAKIQVQSFTNGLDLFFLDNGHYPTTSEGLAALYKKPPGADTWNGPYLRGNFVPNDPWNNAYIYRSPGDGRPYEIVSLGSTGHEGGTGSAAAIVSWQQ